jgi:hypothetical protein
MLSKSKFFERGRQLFLPLLIEDKGFFRWTERCTSHRNRALTQYRLTYRKFSVGFSHTLEGTSIFLSLDIKRIEGVGFLWRRKPSTGDIQSVDSIDSDRWIEEQPEEGRWLFSLSSFEEKRGRRLFLKTQTWHRDLSQKLRDEVLGEVLGVDSISTQISELINYSWDSIGAICWSFVEFWLPNGARTFFR